MTERRARAWAGAITALYLLLQLVTLSNAALTDDDDFYIPAGISYAEWLGKALTFDGFTRQAIDAAFQTNREHPPFAKYVFGICHFAFRNLVGPADAARVGTVLFSTLIAWLLVWLSIVHFGTDRGVRIGALSVLALLTLPRFYFHSHAATLDVPVAAMILATTALLLRAERSWKAAIGAGVVFGLAISTKLNAPFLGVAYVLYVLLTRPWPREGEPGLRLPPIPLALVSLVVIGPLVFLLSWPWLWFDFTQRIAEYVGFHLHHYGILFLYFGRVYSANPFAPWHAPFVMAGSTTPIATLGLAMFGLFLARRPITARLRFKSGPDDDYRREGDLLLFSLLCLLVMISVVAFAGTPIYGGEKLFMPFFPFLCLFAGYGANALYERLLAELPLAPRARAALAASIVSIAAGSGVALMLRFGSYALSEYNGLFGGLRGATATGFERQYYDLAFRDLARWLSADAPSGLRVHFLPNNWEYVRTYRWYQQEGEVRPDISVVSNEAQAQWIVITHERRFARYGDDLLRYRNARILKEKRVDGVPIWTVVER
jgi:4-amino-4-deoxy-L-arabinose transferase-like glycosyltransferase